MSILNTEENHAQIERAVEVVSPVEKDKPHTPKLLNI